MNFIDTAMKSVMQQGELTLETDRRHLMHPGTHAADHASGQLDARLMSRAKGIRMEDHAGRSYIDAFAGLYCVNIGYGREEMADAIAAQTRQLSFYHTYAGFSNDPAVELSRRLIEDWAPPGMKKVFYGMSGSDANETQVKLAWYYNNVLGRPRKKKIIARQRSYHGSGIATGSLTGQPKFHAGFDLPMPQVLHTASPDFYRDARRGASEAEFVADCVEDLEQLIAREGADTIAAFFGEPVMGSGGIVPPPAGYWPAIQAVLARHEILFVVDEVVCGFGRLGSRTGSEHYGLKPDLMSMAKGLTSGYLPLSAVMVSERVWDVIERGSRAHGAMSHGWTYSGHPVCAAAALANLDIIEREQLVGRAAEVGAYLQARLHDAFDAHPLVGNVRGVGMLAALELMADGGERRPFPAAVKASQRVAQAALARGLIVRALGTHDIVGFAPPLVATRADVDEIVAITRDALHDVSDALLASLAEDRSAVTEESQETASLNK
ncbi:aminotransferase [Paraburkholderia phenoliruptrix]|uniref:aminotransferase n=1 Tax=Paraburkholderia phenoliruptrix TaxID=252970 RepID=UPI0028699C91|nr:aminotransferase [Paraburkholderia phenoliruptrix]WMY10848.1 aminotransferase [Paraburkholderia phenoliruptrix]